MECYDRIIIGAGMYGLYAATILSSKGLRTIVIDMEPMPFKRGSFINQARLHNGYHYPRSYSTASKSASYFKRFFDDFGDCVYTDFTKIYALAEEYSWTNGRQFKKFCDNINLRCEEIDKTLYFNQHTIDKAFLTKEYTFDAKLLGDKLFTRAQNFGCEFALGTSIKSIIKEDGQYCVVLEDGRAYSSGFVLNATYAGTNQIHRFLNFEMLPIKYELCEVILCNVSNNIKHVGLTVMDGPFFSVMPFGKTGYHSITTVSRTPHATCYDSLPTFSCQKNEPICTPECSQNCNNCEFHPLTAFSEMAQIANKYLNEDIQIDFIESLFTLKPILKASEIDDSRPTLIRRYSDNPTFYTVFSGKLNTMYDLDSIL